MPVQVREQGYTQRQVNAALPALENVGSIRNAGNDPAVRSLFTENPAFKGSISYWILDWTSAWGRSLT